MPTNPVSIGFNVPFHEAIAQATKRGVVLPDVYYGQLQGLARQQAFSIAGITSLDTLQAVKDSLDKVIKEGGTFGAWKKQMLESGTLNLPKYRLDNIYRTNLQGSYMAARWDRILLTQETRPYIMYDAINDSRVRPSHLALDGMIRRIDDPFWKTHSPPNGYRCRCSIRSLSEHQAKARSGQGKGLNQQPVLDDGTPALPDKGWDYNPSDRLAGVNKALVDKRIKSNPVLMQALDAKLAGMEIINNEFIPAKTVKEAEKYLVDNNIVDFADFGKIKDVAIVNEWSRALFETIKAYPELREAQKFTGSIQARNKILYEYQLNDYLEKLKVVNAGHNIPDKALKDYAKKHIKKRKINDNWLAVSLHNEIVGGISINEVPATGLNLHNLQSILDKDVKDEFRPVGSNSIKANADHELGHELDNLLKIKEQKEVIAIFEQLTNDNLIKTEVSEYAKTSIEEFIAECWAEYKNSSKPRRISEKIGRIIDNTYSRLRI